MNASSSTQQPLPMRPPQRRHDQTSAPVDMIIREWKGRTTIERADEYPAHFRTVVMDDLRSVSGFLGADLVRRDLADQVEFTVLSRWESMDAVNAFSRGDADRAVVEPGAIAALTDFDTHVTHHQVVESIDPRRA
jgi:heme-degrading monooxygenase HmoA